jgi:hypothetical protein
MKNYAISGLTSFNQTIDCLVNVKPFFPRNEFFCLQTFFATRKKIAFQNWPEKWEVRTYCESVKWSINCFWEVNSSHRRTDVFFNITWNLFWFWFNFIINYYGLVVFGIPNSEQLDYIFCKVYLHQYIFYPKWIFDCN